MSYIDSLDGAIVSFLNYGTGTCIDLSGGGKANGTQIIGYQFHGGKNQQWRLCKVNNDAIWPVWIIRNVHTNTNLDLYNGIHDNGAKVSGWTGGESTTNTNQLWRLVTADTKGRIFMIQNVGTGTYVDLMNGNRANSTQICGWAGNVESQNPHQLWRVLRMD
ncbi:carbohydrate-binding module family 13 protein [Hypoxylon rubiginosum]|uniref:Carbohydrate-binding module family 13 protein n=1 Tax=Hypoxylon rubiginosum TaxID=110542 RepID=A0ACB9Z0P5_9PEZI|nr:carbohydrate-binding module family 13 protein [Hypoxylon rubiginosum]